jgi:hypothetical protein
VAAFKNLCVSLGATAYWGGDEASGTNLDDPVGGFDATILAGGGTITYQAESVCPVEPPVFAHDGSSSLFATAPIGCDPVSGANPWSIACWTKLDASGGGADYQTLFRTGVTAPFGAALYYVINDPPIYGDCETGNGSTTIAAHNYHGTPTVTRGTVNFLVGTYNGSVMRFYVNGVEASGSPSGTLTPLVAGDDTAATIGGYAGVKGKWMPLVLFKGTCLTQQNVTDLYASGQIVWPPAGADNSDRKILVPSAARLR